MRQGIPSNKDREFDSEKYSSSTHKSEKGNIELLKILKKHKMLFLFIFCILTYGLSRLTIQFLKIRDANYVTPNSLNVETKCSKFRQGLGLDGIDMGCPPEVKRVVGYCNQHLHAGLEGKGNGKGGSVSDGENFLGASSDDWELVQLVLSIRHGDRTSIYKMPGGFKHQYDSDAIEAYMEEAKRKKSNFGLQHPIYGSKYLDTDALSHVPRLKNYVLRSIPAEEADAQAKVLGTDVLEAKQELVHGFDAHPEMPADRPLPPALDPERIFTTSDLSLGPGQLTSRGFMQHIELGTSLGTAYNNFLKQNIHTREDIKVRSTNYARTIQSVAAFLMSMLPDLGSPTVPVPVTVHQGDEKEVMHGINARCAPALHKAKEQKSKFTLDSYLRSRLEKLFVVTKESESFANTGDMSSAYVTDIADAALPKLCHNMPLPCGSTSDGACMTEEDVGQVMAQADRAFCNRYTGEDGGNDSTRINAYPFLKEMVHALLSNSNSNSKSSTNSNSNKKSGPKPKLYVYSGHDTVIAPVLAALGVYKSERCIWPPYASRVALELWKKTNSEESGSEGLYFRVLYNGDDLTKNVPGCDGSSPCKIQTLHDRLDSLLKPHESLHAACQ
jgi:hypothetical protein